MLGIQVFFPLPLKPTLKACIFFSFSPTLSQTYFLFAAPQCPVGFQAAHFPTEHAAHLALAGGRRRRSVSLADSWDSSASYILRLRQRGETSADSQPVGVPRRCTSDAAKHMTTPPPLKDSINLPTNEFRMKLTFFFL